ncbi:hypothetical protein Tco_0087956 [Tanacetum coccineum]
MKPPVKGPLFHYVYRSNSREISGKRVTIVFLDGFIGLLSKSHRHSDMKNYNIHVSLRNVRLPSHAFRLMQCTGHVPEEKSHFMVKEGIVLGHKISKNGIEVDKAKVDVIAKLPHPTTVKGFAKVMLKYGLLHCILTPRISGQGEAFRTLTKTSIGCTPYKLMYGKACHIPIELEHKAYWALKHANFDLETVGDHRKVQLNELNELRDHAYENSLIYKEKNRGSMNSKIKNCVFNVGDQVLLFNS